jgi:predicted LPLAT superfamily acyltransferase
MTTPRPAGQASAPDWKNLPERSNASAMRSMAWLSVRAGRRMTRAIVYAIAAYFYFFGGSARRASRDYLERALGKPPTALQQYRHILHFATVVHDRIFFLKGRFALFDIQLHGDQLFAHDHAQGIPLLLMGAHVGSFEALRALGEKTGIRVSMLMYQDNAAKMNAVLAALNPEPAPKVISLQRVDAMLVAQADLREGRVLGMLADRRLAHEPADDHLFLGAPAAFPRNPYRLAYILKCKVYFMAALYLGSNRYAIHLVPLADFSREPDSGGAQGGRAAQIAAAQAAYVKTLEATTRSAVINWFNFYDFWRDAKGGR